MQRCGSPPATSNNEICTLVLCLAETPIQKGSETTSHNTYKALSSAFYNNGLREVGRDGRSVLDIENMMIPEVLLVHDLKKGNG